MRLTESRLAYAMLTTAVLLWGGSTVGGKFLVGDLPPFAAAGGRTIVGTVFLFFLLNRMEGLVVPRRSDWPMLFTLGLTGIFGANAFVFLAFQYTTAINGGVIIAGSPIIITLLSALILRERISHLQIIGIIFSFVGVVVVITKGSLSLLFGHGLNIGDLILLANPICWALYTVLTKKIVNRYSPLAISSYAHIVGVLLFMPFAVYELVSAKSAIHVSALDIGVIAYLGIFAACVGTLLWNKAIAKVGASRTGIFMNGVPITTMLLSAVLLGERIAWPQILGSAMIITGVFLNSVRRSAKIESQTRGTISQS